MLREKSPILKGYTVPPATDVWKQPGTTRSGLSETQIRQKEAEFATKHATIAAQYEHAKDIIEKELEADVVLSTDAPLAKGELLSLLQDKSEERKVKREQQTQLLTRKATAEVDRAEAGNAMLKEMCTAMQQSDVLHHCHE